MIQRRFIYSLLVLMLCSLQVFAQAIPKSEIGKVKMVGQDLIFTVQSPEAFYVGGNVHVLHIGSLGFSLSEQSDKEGKDGKLDFIIPKDAIHSFTEGDKIYLTYGEVFDGQTSDEEIDRICKSQPNTCLFLGSYSNTLLDK